MDNKELQHYGVAGMKWGHRRGVESHSIYTQSINRKLGSLEKKRLKNQEKAKKNKEKAKAKDAKIKNKIDRYGVAKEKMGKYDKYLNDQAKSMSRGKALVTDLILGTVKLKYNALRTAGYGKGVSAITSVLDPELHMTRPRAKRKKK